MLTAKPQLAVTATDAKAAPFFAALVHAPMFFNAGGGACFTLVICAHDGFLMLSGSLYVR